MGRPIHVSGDSHRKLSEVGPDRAIAELAERQHGMVERGQLRGIGLLEAAIEYRLRVGRLYAWHRGVYSVGQRKVSKEGHWMAAVLAGGAGAVLSHRSAAQLWGLRSGITVPVDVTVARNRGPRKRIRFHRSPLPFDEVTTRERIPVTSVPRSILDLAAGERPRALERLINQADVQRLWDRLSLDDLLERHPNRAGSAALRAALRARREGATVTKSELEEKFIGLVDEFGLPRPEINAWLPVDGRGFSPDALWRGQRLIVELDSREFHANDEAFEADRERDRRLEVAGWSTIRVTDRMLTAERRQLVGDLRHLLDRSPPPTMRR